VRSAEREARPAKHFRRFVGNARPFGPGHPPGALGRRHHRQQHVVAGPVGRPPPRNDSNSPEDALSIFAAWVVLGITTAVDVDGIIHSDIFPCRKLQSRFAAVCSVRLRRADALGLLLDLD